MPYSQNSTKPKHKVIAIRLHFLHGGMIEENAFGYADTVDVSTDRISRENLEVVEPQELDLSLWNFVFDGVF